MNADVRHADSDRLPRFARWIKAFTDNPFTKLSVGLILIITSSAETYYSFHDDLTQVRMRVHHGLLVLGFVNVLAAIPGLIQGFENFLAFREEVPSLTRLKHRSERSRT